MNPVTSPSARWIGSIAYESESDRVVIFGGELRDHTRSDETWAYDFNTNTWANMNPTSNPGMSCPMAYDSESGRIICFVRGYYSNLNETWVYDFNIDTWTEMSPSASPSPRFGHAMAYDQESDRVILFGGFIKEPRGRNDETWAYDFNMNTWTNMKPSTRPSARDTHAMAYDSKSDRAILFGGDPGGEGGIAPDNQTWAYDFNGNTWTQMNPTTGPAARMAHKMAYDFQSDRVILYGGVIGAALRRSNETWSYDFNSNAWTEMNWATRPSIWGGSVMTYDSESDRIILFGPTPSPGPGNETWAYEHSPTPPKAPRNLRTAAGNSSVKLSWSPPSSDGESPITKYRIYRGTESGDLTLLLEVGTTLEYTDTSVTNGVTYHYQVSAVNSAGEGPSSNEVSAMPTGISNTPPIASFTVTPETGDTATIFIVDASASSDVEDPVTALEVRWDWEDDGAWDTPWTTEKTAEHQYAGPGTYTIRLEVRDTGGLTGSTARQVEVSAAPIDPALVVSVLVVTVPVAVLVFVLLRRRKLATFKKPEKETGTEEPPPGSGFPPGSRPPE